MHTRTLGRNGPSVSALGLGCMGMSAFYGEATDEAQSIAVLHKALDLGVTLFDTAEMYGPNTNEILLGKAFKDRRDKAVIATKFGVKRQADGSSLTDGSARNVRASVEGSLKRLQTDYIDIYFQHRIDPDTPIEETAQALAELVKEGKIRHYGLSEAAPETIRRAHAVHPVTALQTEYSLWSRDPEDGLLDLVRELGIGFVPYSPLGRGFLSGQIKTLDDLDPTDFRRTNPRFNGENFQKNIDLVKAVEQIAADKGVTAAQLALAWVLAQGDDLVPIPGTRRLATLQENIGAADVKLSSEDLQRIEQVFPRGAAAGDRYAEGGMKGLNR